MKSIEHTACCTGHRFLPKVIIPTLTQKLDETIARLISQGVSIFLNGGALGFDQLAASAVLRQRETNHDVKLIIMQPCQNQDARWKLEDQLAYRRMLNAADRTVCLSEHYYDGCMAVRNRMMVEVSSVCVSYLTRGRSGTAQTIRMAREQGLTVINLA
jgi:uncharacterized phage-like protein YoqJ